MKKKFLDFFSTSFVVIFLLAVFDVAASKTASSQGQAFRIKSHPNFNKNFSGTAFVLDGDSIKVGKKEVRLFGLDSPEYSQTCFNEKDEEYSCGQVSRDFLTNLVGGKQVKCVYAEKDKYDRFLSKCYLDNLSINQEIVKNGMAIIYSFTEADEEMEKLELEAKEKKLGIWKGKFQKPQDYRKSHPYKK